jgi:hypothetical protein
MIWCHRNLKSIQTKLMTSYKMFQFICVEKIRDWIYPKDRSWRSVSMSEKLGKIHYLEFFSIPMSLSGSSSDQIKSQRAELSFRISLNLFRTRI